MLVAGLGLGAWLAHRIVADRDATRARAAREARAFARRAAAALPARLADPAVLATAPEDARFALAADRDDLEVPPELGWLDSPPEFAPRAGLDPLTAERLRRAECAPAAERTARLAALAADDHVALPAASRCWLRAAAAWHAHRNGDAAQRDALLDALPPTAPPPVQASAALLRIRTGRADAEVPAWWGRLAPARAAATLRALDDGGAADVATRWRSARTSLDAQRARLRTVRDTVPALPRAGPVQARRAGDLLLLFEPTAGRGAALDAGAAARLAADTLGTEVRPADAAGADAVPALGGLLAVPVPDWSVDATAGYAEGALVAVLMLMLVAGAGLAWRGVRRELQALRTQADFLTTVTHELKTPLAGIRLAAELLADDHVTAAAERRDWLRRLDGEAARLGMLVENVLDLGRSERGERALSPQQLDLAAWLDETLLLFEPLAARDGLALLRDVAADLPPVHADPDALRQALLNLLDNARKYGRAGGRIEVRAQRGPGGGALLTVRDHGPGVPAGERDRVFERFRRGDAWRSGQVPGVGLGLHLARILVRRHGGTLRCVPPPAGGSGACFELSLPTTDTSTHTHRPAASG